MGKTMKEIHDEIQARIDADFEETIKPQKKILSDTTEKAKEIWRVAKKDVNDRYNQIKAKANKEYQDSIGAALNKRDQATAAEWLRFRQEERGR